MPDKQKLRDIGKEIDTQIKSARERKIIKTQLKRAEYKEELQAFISHFKKQASSNNIKRFDIRFYGSEITTKRDVIYISWIIDDVTHEKTDNVVEFIRLLVHEAGISEYFDANQVFVDDHEAKKGQTVDVIVYRHGHEWIDDDPIDVIGKPDDDEGGDGGGGGGSSW